MGDARDEIAHRDITLSGFSTVLRRPVAARQRQRLRICGVRLLKLGVVRASCPQVTLVASSTVVPTNSRRCSPAAARTPIVISVELRVSEFTT
jgi:hypothetical protein